MADRSGSRRGSWSTPAARAGSSTGRSALADAPLRWLPPTQALFTPLRGCRPMGRPACLRRNAALSARRCGASSCVSRRLDLGAAVQQRDHERRRGADRSAGRSRRRRRRRAGLGPAARDPAVGAGSVPRARAVHPFVHAPRLAFRARCGDGPPVGVLPSAAGVIDPLLSTGFPLTLLGITRLLEHPGRDRRRDPNGRRRSQAYARITELELDATEQLVAALYANMTDAPLFKRLTLLYFAVASYSEAARRLGRPELAPGFLLHAHPTFGPELRACARAGDGRAAGPTREALLGSHRPRDRAVRYRRPARSHAPRLVSGAARRSPRLGVEARRDGGGGPAAARTLRIRATRAAADWPTGG